MDKRGLKILFGCMACTMLVVILFLVALQFARPPCELILETEPEKLGQLLEQRSKAIKSRDKFITVKMSAYLEYHLSTEPLSNVQQQPPLPNALPTATNSLSPAHHQHHPTTAALPPSGQLPSTGLQQQSPTLNLTNQLPAAPIVTTNQSLNVNPAGNNFHQSVPSPSQPLLQIQPQPHLPSTATVTSVFNGNNQVTGRPLNNTSMNLPQQQVTASFSTVPGAQLQLAAAPTVATGAGAAQQSVPIGAPINNGFSSDAAGHTTNALSKDKRFLPLELEGVISSKKDHYHKIALNFNCTTMVMRLKREQFNNRTTRASIDQINLELRVPGHQGKTSCQLALPAKGTFITEVDPILNTDKSPHCFYRVKNDSKNKQLADRPLFFNCINQDTKETLADLHILHFEYELDNRSKKDSFFTVGHNCVI